MHIDLITEIAGVTFDEAWANRVEYIVDDELTVTVIGKDDLIRNKRHGA